MYLRYAGNPPRKGSSQIDELSETLNRLGRSFGIATGYTNISALDASKGQIPDSTVKRADGSVVRAPFLIRRAGQKKSARHKALTSDRGRGVAADVRQYLSLIARLRAPPGLRVRARGQTIQRKGALMQAEPRVLASWLSPGGSTLSGPRRA